MSSLYTVVCPDSSEIFLGIFGDYAQARKRAENFLENKRNSLTVNIYLSKLDSKGSNRDLLTTVGAKQTKKPVPVPRRVL
jgi:hypothetical protein